eukprot:6283315-Pyramimonas_sp.AAC.1
MIPPGPRLRKMLRGVLSSGRDAASMAPTACEVRGGAELSFLEGKEGWSDIRVGSLVRRLAQLETYPAPV